MKLNKKGTEKMTAVYWFAILLIVAGAIAYMVFVFYGRPYSVKQVEAEILTNQIANCLAEGGYLKGDIVKDLNGENLLERCNLNFDVEDFSDWKEKGQYYVEIEIYEFDESLPEGYVGSQVIPKIVYGNPSLKPVPVYEGKEYEKNVVVIHYTDTGGSGKIVERILKEKKLSIHYIIDRGGGILECEIDVWKLKGCTLKDISEVTGTWEKTSAQHTGCFSGGKWLDECSLECMTEADLLIPKCNKGICCIRGFNQKSIGIELVNYGHRCNGRCKEDEMVEIGGKIWQSYTQEQIDALVELVAGIVERNDISIDSNHIIGHENITNNKPDPGSAFYWEDFMKRLEERVGQEISEEEDNIEVLSLISGRSFYVVDKNNNQYVIKIWANVGKNEKNEG